MRRRTAPADRRSPPNHRPPPSGVPSIALATLWLALGLPPCLALAGGGRLLAQEPAGTVRALSFNIRYGTAEDGPNHWRVRRDDVAAAIRRNRPHVLGVQEALAFQLDELAAVLPGYRVLGQGREGGRGGEHCALWIDERRFAVVRNGDVWLSGTPDVPGSRGWDAALPRIATWAVLRDRLDHTRLLVVNTHLDHVGSTARLESARCIARLLARTPGLPALVLGDLNCGEDSAPLEVLRAAGLRDTFRALHPGAEDTGTFSGFAGRTGGRKIDYVLCGGDLQVVTAWIDRTRTDDGRDPSDHWPVGAELRWRRPGPPRLMPVLEGPFWRLCGAAELGELGDPRQEIVDHAIWRSDQGRWHLWACVRRTAVGRVLHGWSGTGLRSGLWPAEGLALRADRAAGESIDDWNGEEWIQAPFVLRHDGVHWMFYGGHRSELDDCQICLSTSPDGETFTRHRDARGHSRVFVGPGEARDPMVLRVGDGFLCYYSGHEPGARAPCIVYCRRSTDLVQWSEPVAVNWGGRAGAGNWSAECPFVVEREGAFYLFRTTSYRIPLTHVYRSTDPLDFGRGSDDCWIGTIAVAAPEIVTDGGEDHVSSVHDLRGGVQLAALRWVDERDAATAAAGLERMQPLWDFEDGTLEGWQLEGTAFANQPTFAPGPAVRGQAFGHSGRWLVGTHEDRPTAESPPDGVQGDLPTGAMRSPSFELPGGWVTFRIGGGRDPERLYAALCLEAGGTELFRATGARSNTMHPVAWDVRAHRGRRAFVRVVDGSSEAWGHVCVDDFRIGPPPR